MSDARQAILAVLLGSLLLGGCSAMDKAPVKTVDYVDLQRFMGDWYVVANIPTFIEVDAHNAVESYRLREDGRIDTTFSFRDGGFDGELKTYRPVGTVADRDSNAVWGMQFIWPFQADYRVMYLNADYSQTVIGRNKRDYVWIMARTPRIPEADLQAILTLLAEQGYDTGKVRPVPQQWPATNQAEVSKP